MKRNIFKTITIYYKNKTENKTKQKKNSMKGKEGVGMENNEQEESPNLVTVCQGRRRRGVKITSVFLT